MQLINIVKAFIMLQMISNGPIGSRRHSYVTAVHVCAFHYGGRKTMVQQMWKETGEE